MKHVTRLVGIIIFLIVSTNAETGKSLDIGGVLESGKVFVSL